jgi:hypothetical protein
MKLAALDSSVLGNEDLAIVTILGTGEEVLEEPELESFLEQERTKKKIKNMHP